MICPRTECVPLVLNGYCHRNGQIIPGAAQGEAAAKAFEEGRYLDAVGHFIGGMGEAALGILPVGRAEKVAQPLTKEFVAVFAKRLERLGGGAPTTIMTTPKGATQFIFPNGMKVRFDLKPGQYSPKQGPHINVQDLPGHPNRNIHIPVKP